MKQIKIKLPKCKRKIRGEKCTLSTRQPSERGTSSIPQPGGNLNLDEKGVYGVMAVLVPEVGYSAPLRWRRVGGIDKVSFSMLADKVTPPTPPIYTHCTLGGNVTATIVCFNIKL